MGDTKIVRVVLKNVANPVAVNVRVGGAVYEIYCKYNNSRVIDYNRWSVAPEVGALVAFLVYQMKAELPVKKIAGYRCNMKTLLMELYHSYLADKEQYLGYHNGHDHYDFKVELGDKPNDARYVKNPFITFTYFTGCVNYLHSKGYVETKIGGHFRDDKGYSYGYLSRMRATDALVDLWGRYGFTPEMIIRFKPDETIVLKGEVQRVRYLHKGRKRTRKYKPLIPDYEDTRDVRDKRKVVEKYNDLLDSTHVDVDVECMLTSDQDELLDRLLDTKDKHRYSINLGAKSVYRVFNNGSFKEGGRYYGAFWIGCPEVMRKYITINGEPTVELDYSGIHIQLLYAYNKINFAELNTDAYELIPNDPERKLNKLILLTAFNAATPEDTANAVFNECRLDGTLHKYNLKDYSPIYERLELLKQKHQPIAGYIAEGFGSKLQYHDSCVIELLIKHFTRYKIPILTVHDSVICQRRYKDFVLDKMHEFYSNQVRDAFRCKVDYQSINPHAKYVFRRSLAGKIADTITPTWLLIKAIIHMSDVQYVNKGTLPKLENTIIEVTDDSVEYVCSGRCKHASRLASIRSGRRIFLGKIRVCTETINDVVSLVITQ